MAEKKQSMAKNITPQVRQLAVGETVSFPIEWLDSVRAVTFKLNAIEGGRRRTYIDKEDRTIQVTREA